MAAHLTRCTCSECERLDRLPARRQGIPGAVQLTFDGGSQPDHRQDDFAAEMAAKMIAKYGNPLGPFSAPPEAGLPLFEGLAPCLF